MLITTEAKAKAKAKSVPFVISISHAVNNKLVRLSTWFSLIEQIISVLLILLNVKNT